MRIREVIEYIVGFFVYIGIALIILGLTGVAVIVLANFLTNVMMWGM